MKSQTRSFYREIISIALPVAFQNLISFAAAMTDSLMLGRADGDGILLSASSLANQPFYILSLICFGISSAVSVFTSQYWGKGDTEKIRILFSMAIRLSASFSAITGFLSVLFPRQIMTVYSSSPEIIELGAQYLRIVGAAYLFYGLSSTFICLLRSIELVNISVAANICTFAVNCFLNYVLIYGKLGFSPMGIKGAAIATFIARSVEFLIIITYVFFGDKRLSFSVKSLVSWDKFLFFDLCKFGLPVFFNELFLGLSSSVHAAILGHITYSSGDPVTANSICGIVQQFSTVTLFGVANAAAVIVGKAIGQGNTVYARKKAHSLLFISYLVGIFCALLILLLKTPVINFYEISAETKALALEMMNSVALITVFISVSSVSIVGILRGAGDTKFGVVTELSAIWFIGIPTGIAAAFVFDMPVPLVIILMKCDEFIKAAVCTVRIFGKKWINTVAER